MIGLILSASLLLSAAAPQAPAAPAVESAVMQHATGTFDVTLTPAAPAADAPAGMPGRMTIDKTFHGVISGHSVGEMLATMEGASGAYVALERVTGAINGRSGTFAMVHVGVVDQGTSDLSIKIVPGSGTGELAGLTGVFHLTIANGGHSYDLEYSLP